MTHDTDLQVQVPDDLSSLDDKQQPRDDRPTDVPATDVPDEPPAHTHDDDDGDGDDDQWHMHVRLVLKSGRTIGACGPSFEFEPYLGNVSTAAMGIFNLTNCTKSSGYIRFITDDDGIFYAPYSEFDGLHFDVYGPDGEEIRGSDIKPGWNSVNGPVEG